MAILSHLCVCITLNILVYIWKPSTGLAIVNELSPLKVSLRQLMRPRSLSTVRPEGNLNYNRSFNAYATRRACHWATVTSWRQLARCHCSAADTPKWLPADSRIRSDLRRATCSQTSPINTWSKIEFIRQHFMQPLIAFTQHQHRQQQQVLASESAAAINSTRLLEAWHKQFPDFAAVVQCRFAFLCLLVIAQSVSVADQLVITARHSSFGLQIL